jgi:ACS family glucarate transporter-like MFS transporter
VRWVILAILVLASFVAYLLRTNMSVAGEGMMRDLGLSQLQLGIVLAAFTWGYTIFQFPGGILDDALGSRRTLAIIAVGWGVANLLTGLIPGGAGTAVWIILTALVALRFIMGAVQAPVFPLVGGTIGRWFPPAGWALPNGLTNTGLALGGAATGPLIAWLMQTVGWRASFIVTAPLAFALAAIWWWYARDTPAEHSAVSQGELEVIDVGRLEHSGVPARGAWLGVLKHRDVLLLTASYFCSNYVFYFFFNWLFIYLVDSRHFKILEGGYYAAAPWIGGAVGAALGGGACDWLSKRLGMRLGCRIPAMAGLVVTAVTMWAAAGAATPVTAVVYLTLCFVAQQATEGAFWAATISVSGRHASIGCGVLNTGGNAVGGIGALVVPITVKALGWPAALTTASVFAVLAAVLWLWIRADRVLVTTEARR